MGAISRLTRLARKQRSVSGFTGALAEEAVVRAYSQPSVRRLIRPLVPVRPARRWVFLVGCYNSGTTILQRILGAHPEIHALPREGVRFQKRLSHLETDGHHMMWANNHREIAHPPEAESEAAVSEIVADWAPLWSRGSGVYLEKSIANTARIAWLSRHFPQSRFIGIYRNGYCVTEGLYRRCRPAGRIREQLGRDRYPIEQAARQWVVANEDLLSGQDSSAELKLVAFEDFVAAPHQVVQSIFEFAGVDPSVCTGSETRVSVNDKSFVVTNPNSASLDRLTCEQYAAVTPILAPMMKRLGYPIPEPQMDHVTP